MTAAQDKRYVSLPYSVSFTGQDGEVNQYGAMTARVGLFKAIFRDGADLVAGCASTLNTVSVKRHDRVRVVGSAPKSIEAHAYQTQTFPRKNVSFGKGGDEYRILVDGNWWGFRISGKQSTFHSFLCSAKSSLLIDVHYKTQSGASYFVNRHEETPE